MPSILTPAPEKINNKSSEVDYLKLEDMCSQMVHLSASEPLQVLRAVYLKLASSYFPAPKIEKFSCAKKNSNRCKVKKKRWHFASGEFLLRPHACKNRPRFGSGAYLGFVGTSSNHYQSGVHPLGNIVKPGSTSVPELSRWVTAPAGPLPFEAWFKT